MLKRLIDRARREAEKRLPSEVVDAGRRVRAQVEHRIGEVLGTRGDEAPVQPAPGGEAPRDKLQRAREQISDDEVAQVIIYATDAEREDIDHIRAVFESKDEPVRWINLAQDARTYRNISGFTGIMVPPYVYIDGRFWGARFDIEALEEEGDLDKILAGQLDDISDVARKIGKIRDSFSDAMTVENITERLVLGHSLCVDDIDSWMDVEDGEQILFHQGGRLTGDAVSAALEELAEDIASGGVEALWRLEPEIKVG